MEEGFRDAWDSDLSHAFAKLGYQRGGTDLALSYQDQLEPSPRTRNSLERPSSRS